MAIGLIAKAIDADVAALADCHQRVAVVFGAGPFDHRDEGAIKSLADLSDVVLVAVPLEDGQDVTAGRVDDFANLGGVADAVVVVSIEPLVGEEDRGEGVGGEVIAEPLEFFGGDVGIGPLEIFAAVGLAIGAEAGIEDDEVDAATIEGIERLFAADRAQEFGFGQRIDAVVPQDVMAVGGDFGEVAVDFGKVAKFGLDRIGGVDDIAQFDDEIGVEGAKLIAGFGEFAEGFAVVTATGGWLVGVMHVGHQADANGGIRGIVL